MGTKTGIGTLRVGTVDHGIWYRVQIETDVHSFKVYRCKENYISYLIRILRRRAPVFKELSAPAFKLYQDSPW